VASRPRPRSDVVRRGRFDAGRSIRADHRHALALKQVGGGLEKRGVVVDDQAARTIHQASHRRLGSALQLAGNASPLGSAVGPPSDSLGMLLNYDSG
jgi:hypothetical protein